MLVTIKHHPEWGLSKFDSIQYIASQIEAMVERSRFTADVETKPNSTVINIRNISSSSSNNNSKKLLRKVQQ